MSHSPLGLPASASSTTPCERCLKPTDRPAGEGEGRLGRPAPVATGAVFTPAAANAIRVRGCVRSLAAPRYPVAKKYVTAHIDARCGFGHGNGIVSLTPTPDHVRCLLWVDDFRDVSAAIAVVDGCSISTPIRRR